MARATAMPASHPGARPRDGRGTCAASIPARMINHEITEFEFHISPTPLSSRPHVSDGTCPTRRGMSRATAGSVLRVTGLCTASDRSGIRPSARQRISQRNNRIRPAQRRPTGPVATTPPHGGVAAPLCRSELDGERPDVAGDHERAVVEIEGTPMMSRRDRRLEQATAPSDDVAGRAQGDPEQVDALGGPCIEETEGHGWSQRHRPTRDQDQRSPASVHAHDRDLWPDPSRLAPATLKTCRPSPAKTTR